MTIKSSKYIEPTEEEIQERKEEEKQRMIWDTVYFWYLMIILEFYRIDNETIKFELSLIGEAYGYSKGVSKRDREIFDEIDRDYQGDTFPDAVYYFIEHRFSDLVENFQEFFIESIRFNGDFNEVAKDCIRDLLIKGGNDLWKNDDSIEEILNTCEILNEREYFQKLRRTRLLTEKFEGKDYNTADLYKPYRIFPPEENYEERKNFIYDLNIITIFGKYSNISLKFKENGGKSLKKYIEKEVFSSFGTYIDVDVATREFIVIAKQSEIIGSTVYIALEKCLEVSFNILQYIYFLQKDGGCKIDSWVINDVFAIKIFDPTIADILGIGLSINNVGNIEKMSYNKDMGLLFDSKHIPLSETNEGFLKEYFDLLGDYERGVAIDDIVERLEPNIWELGAEAIPKKKKSLSYDRVTLLNRKIAKLTGITGLFKIENGYIKLTSEIRVEKESKTLER